VLREADKPPGEAQGGVLRARPEGPKRADKPTEGRRAY
jgi:hypothetical protein